MSTTARQPAGTPTGGQFAPGRRSDPEVVLAAAADKPLPAILETSNGPVPGNGRQLLGGALVVVADEDVVADAYPDASAPLGELHVSKQVFDAVRNDGMFSMRLGEGDKQSFNPVGKRVSEALDRHARVDPAEAGPGFPDRFETTAPIDGHGMAWLRDSTAGDQFESDTRYAIRLRTSGGVTTATFEPVDD